MNMIFKRLQTGIYGTNCYILGDRETKEALVLDPGGDLEDIAGIINKESLAVKYILLTHGHGDHLGAADDLRKITGAQLAVHKADLEMVKDAQKNMSKSTGGKEVTFEPDLLLEDGQVIQLGAMEFKVLHTPGHTKGSVCFLAGENLFSGDTLFRASVGRTDLYGGSHEQLIRSIRRKLFILPENTEVYPGHGAATTIGYEKRSNPYVR